MPVDAFRHHIMRPHAAAAVVAAVLLCQRVDARVPCVCAADNCTFSSPGTQRSISYARAQAHAVCGSDIEDVQSHPHESVLAPIVILGVGALTRHVLQLTGLRIPYTVNLLLFGAGLGLMLQYLTTRPLERAASEGGDACRPAYLWQDELQRSIANLAAIDPHLLLHVFIPPLIFESASAIEWHVFYQLKWAALLLALPGVIASTFALGALINFLYSQPHVSPDDDAFAWPTMAGNLLGVRTPRHGTARAAAMRTAAGALTAGRATVPCCAAAAIAQAGRLPH